VFCEKFEKLGARLQNSPEMIRPAGSGLNYMSQKDRCGARGGMLG